VDLPAETLGAGQVRLRVTAAAVNPADIGVRTGWAGTGRCRSMAMSYEFTGENAVQCISMRVCNTLLSGRSGRRGVQTRLFCMCVVWLAAQSGELASGERVLGGS
jgi:hypothetical protein